MNTLEALLREHYHGQIRDPRGIIATAVGYLLRVRSSNDLTHAVREQLPGAPVINFRKELQKGYFLRNLKLWIWRILTLDAQPAHARRMMDVYEIRPEDIEIARVVKRDRELNTDLTTLVGRYRSHRLSDYDQHLAGILEELDSYIQRFVRRKLMFITLGGFMSIDDLVTDMKMFALYAMRLQYPKVETRLHLVNVAKRAIHNFGMNTIQQYTTKSRQHLRRETDGTFSAVKISLDSNAAGYQPNMPIANVFGEASDTGTHSELIDRLSVSRAVEQQTGKRKQFTELLLGNYNEEFSEWLHELDYVDNDELLDVLIAEDDVNEYVSLAAEFVGISDYQADVILRNIRSTL